MECIQNEVKGDEFDDVYSKWRKHRIGVHENFSILLAVHIF